MLGALAGLCGWLWKSGLAVPAAISCGRRRDHGAAYDSASRHDVDGTTEVAALVVLAAGLLAGTGAVRLASAIIALEALLLVEKSRLHALCSGSTTWSFAPGCASRSWPASSCRCAGGTVGPLGGIRPRELWALVLFFSALSFLGHVARRLVGSGQGYFVTGLIGGLVSSTNVTFTFARLSRGNPALERALAFGAVGANTVLYLRVLAATAVLNAALVPVPNPVPGHAGACRRRDRRDQPAQDPRTRARRSCRRTIRCSCARRCKWRFCFKGSSWSCFSRVRAVGGIRRVDVGGCARPD